MWVRGLPKSLLGKTLLDREALGRTIARIAHEIAERNSRPHHVSPSSEFTREACRSPIGCAG